VQCVTLRTRVIGNRITIATIIQNQLADVSSEDSFTCTRVPPRTSPSILPLSYLHGRVVLFLCRVFVANDESRSGVPERCCDISTANLCRCYYASSSDITCSRSRIALYFCYLSFELLSAIAWNPCFVYYTGNAVCKQNNV